MPIYGLRIRPLGPTAYYSAVEEWPQDSYVLVHTEHGPAVGKIISGPLTLLPGSSESDLPAIIRLANDEDMEIWQKNIELSKEAKKFCRKCIYERELDMKLVDVEVFFDRSKLLFYFTAPSRIDFRDLVKELVRQYRTRIELRQIGVRHEAQMVGAIGNCGRVCCCHGHLRKFAPVTIKMAKEQNLFLNPAKISGICGRLLCCLSYEQDNYEQFHHTAPRPGKKYPTSQGLIKILRINMFSNSVTGLNEKNEEIELTMEEWQKICPQCIHMPCQTDTDSDPADEEEYEE